MRSFRMIFAATTLAAAALTCGIAAARPAGTDAAADKRVFLRCMACHTAAPGAPNKVGPNLAGVVGRKAGQVKGFRYSPALAKSNVSWDEATLDRWLQRPAALVPGTSMVFAGLPSADDRKAVIAYLKKPVP